MSSTPKTHTAYSPSNPYWQRTADRLRDQGGQYAPSTTTNAPDVLRGEPGVALARDAYSLDPNAEPAPF